MQRRRWARCVDSKFVMAGLEPATQWPRVCAAKRLSESDHSPDGLKEFLARTDVRALGGRLKAGHDEPREGRS